MTLTIKNNTEEPRWKVEEKLVQRSRILEKYTITDLGNVHNLVK